MLGPQPTPCHRPECTHGRQRCPAGGLAKWDPAHLGGCQAHIPISPQPPRGRLEHADHGANGPEVVSSSAWHIDEMGPPPRLAAAAKLVTTGAPKVNPPLSAAGAVFTPFSLCAPPPSLPLSSPYQGDSAGAAFVSSRQQHQQLISSAPFFSKQPQVGTVCASAAHLLGRFLTTACPEIPSGSARVNAASAPVWILEIHRRF